MSEHRAGRYRPDDEFDGFLADGGTHDGGHIVQHIAEPEGRMFDLEPSGLDLREVQDVVDDAQERTTGVADLLHHIVLGGADRAVSQQVGKTQDGVHGCADFVAHVGEELTLRHARRVRGLLRALQFDRQAFELTGSLAEQQVGPTFQIEPALFLVFEHEFA